MNEQATLSVDDLRKLEQIPAIRISMSQRFDDYRALTFDTHVMADCDEQELNERLDKLRNAAERQKAISHLPTAKGLLEDKRSGFKKESDKLMGLEAEASVLSSRWTEAQVASGRRGALKISPQQKSDQTRIDGQIASSRMTLNQLLQEIAVYERQIADMEALVAGGGDASDREPAGL